MTNPGFFPSMSRRTLLKSAACGFGYTALAGLFGELAAAESRNPLAPKAPHFTPRAKRVIFLFMRGGPSQVDTFDYKPRLTKDDGREIADDKKDTKWWGSPWKFNQHGEGGLWIADNYPHLAQHADKLCLLNGMHTDVPNHPQAVIQMHTGATTFIRPSLGSWALYGLGTENQDLPGFVTLNPSPREGGAQNYGSAFLPATYQGMRIGNDPDEISKAKVSYLANSELTPAMQRKQLDLLQAMNRDRLETDEVNQPLEGVIESFELAFRMQSALPKLMDISGETQATLDAYGIGPGGRADNFGHQCLLARRFAEAGVRFIELCHSSWDQHADLYARHERNARETDKPMAALISDLAVRGMLDDTLILWGGEFGRTPFIKKEDGRDHNAKGFTMWMAGGGVKGGFRYGATDEHGVEAVEGRMHVHDLHATILHLLGFDHEQLTYRYSGRDFRLTDVYGRVVKDILA